MRDPLFEGFMLLDGSTLRSIASDDERPGAVTRRSMQTAGERVQALVSRLASLSDDKDGERTSAIISALESALEGQSAILQLASATAGSRRDATRRFLEQVIKMGSVLDDRRQEDAIAKLADVMLPDELGAARGILAADNLKLRDEFLAKVPTLTGRDVGNRVGHSKSNPHATAARWKKANEIFSVHHRGAEYFPAFQFRDDGRPNPTVKTVLAALPPRLTPWQRAFWFISTNGWLNDKAPADVLDQAEAAVAAAEREAEDVIG